MIEKKRTNIRKCLETQRNYSTTTVLAYATNYDIVPSSHKLARVMFGTQSTIYGHVKSLKREGYISDIGVINYSKICGIFISYLLYRYQIIIRDRDLIYQDTPYSVEQIDHYISHHRLSESSILKYCIRKLLLIHAKFIQAKKISLMEFFDLVIDSDPNPLETIYSSSLQRKELSPVFGIEKENLDFIFSLMNYVNRKCIFHNICIRFYEEIEV